MPDNLPGAVWSERTRDDGVRVVTVSKEATLTNLTVTPPSLWQRFFAWLHLSNHLRAP